MTGCYVDSIIDLSKGQFLELGIRLPGGEWLGLPGLIAFAFPRMGFGFEFSELHEEQRIKLQNLMNSLAEPDEEQTSRICA
jgi:hypothetical protein